MKATEFEVEVYHNGKVFWGGILDIGNRHEGDCSVRLPGRIEHLGRIYSMPKRICPNQLVYRSDNENELVVRW